MIHEAQLSDLLEGVRDYVRKHITVSSVDEVEAAAVELGQVVSHVVVDEAMLQISGKQTYMKSSIQCECGRRARFVEYRRRGLSTLCGVVEVERAYYHCKHCHSGHLPWDVSQGLNGLLWTPQVKALVAEMAARLPYREVTTLLRRLVNLRLEESSAEAIVLEVGDRARNFESEVIRAAERGEPVSDSGPAPSRLYVAMDGSHCHVGRAWHEIKTGVVYRGILGPKGLDVSGDKYYVSAREPAELFGGRLYAAAGRCGVEEAGEVVVIGDGAEWIWNLASHHYPNATQIVDYWHACEHIHDAAKRLYGEGAEAGQRWARDHCHRLKEEGPKSLLRALSRRKAKTPEAAEAIRSTQGYFRHHAQRMDYPAFRRRGLMIGSGPAEAACKVVVGHRLKQAGMRWQDPGADAILALRCLVLNGRHDEIHRAAKAA